MGVLNSFFGILALPIVLLATCNIVDYITGLMASKFRGQQISSYKGIRGIAKKVAMWLLVAVGAIMDALIEYSVEQLGFSCPFSFMIAAVVAVWIVCNELISILENLKDMEAPIPEFLMKLTKNMKSQIETKADVIKEEEK
jgi:toxin secretion/phage lysis holin